MLRTKDFHPMTYSMHDSVGGVGGLIRRSQAHHTGHLQPVKKVVKHKHHFV